MEGASKFMGKVGRSTGGVVHLGVGGRERAKSSLVRLGAGRGRKSTTLWLW